MTGDDIHVGDPRGVLFDLFDEEEARRLTAEVLRELAAAEERES